MNLLKKIGLGLGILIILLILISFLLPREVSVERSIEINASKDLVHTQINTLKNWDNWSPWHDLDPNMEQMYEGPASGEGAIYRWKSEQDNVGNGAMKIIESSLDTIKMSLDFMEEGTAFSNFIFEPSENKTKLTWTFSTDMGFNPMGRYMGLMIDKFVGADYEKGLNKLKTFVENMPKPKIDINETEVDPLKVLTIREKCKPQEISQVLGKLYGEIGAYMGENNLKQAAQPLSIYYGYSEHEVDLEAGIPIDQENKGNERIVYKELKGKTVVADYYGSYDHMSTVYEKLQEWMKENNKEPNGVPWEHYITDPGTEKDPSKWHTKVCFPIK